MATSESSTIGWVYFVRVQRLKAIKIGWSTSVPDRMVKLKAQLRSRIDFMGARVGSHKDESEAHVLFQHLRLDGEREIFHDSDEIEKHVLDTCLLKIPSPRTIRVNLPDDVAECILRVCAEDGISPSIWMRALAIREIRALGSMVGGKVYGCVCGHSRSQHRLTRDRDGEFYGSCAECPAGSCKQYQQAPPPEKRAS